VEDREFDVEVKGIQRLLAVSVLPLVKDRRVTGSLVHVEDITEKRGKEARLRRAENLASLTTSPPGWPTNRKIPLGSISIHIQLIQKALKASRVACLDTPGTMEGSSPIQDISNAPFDLLDKYLMVVNEEIDRIEPYRGGFFDSPSDLWIWRSARGTSTM